MLEQMERIERAKRTNAPTARPTAPGPKAGSEAEFKAFASQLGLEC
ncbi:MAG TPA: hypothetical protein VM238_21160 [Phycisphaerae bacterium]|nr:hypothetical protein [Phycisphaerae bacterium]